MSKESLKRWRLVIPGALLLFFALPIWFRVIGSTLVLDPKNAVLVAIVLLLGGLYDAFDLRKFFMRPPIAEIRENIRRKLIEPFIGKPEFTGVEQLSTDNLVRVFYSIVDNDNSLSDQSNDVRLNGLYLSTVCDVATVASFAIPSYLLVGFVEFALHGVVPPCILFSGVGCVCLFFITPKLIRHMKRVHIDLGNEQLAHIDDRKELSQQLNNKLSHLLTSKIAP